MDKNVECSNVAIRNNRFIILPLITLNFIEGTKPSLLVLKYFKMETEICQIKTEKKLGKIKFCFKKKYTIRISENIL